MGVAPGLLTPRPRAVVVVPWRPGCSYRERNWRFLCNGYTLPTTEAHGPTPWVKALAVMPEVARLRCEVVVIADADVLVSNVAIELAVVKVLDGEVPWAMPHTKVRRLTDQGTEALIRHEAMSEDEERPYVGLDGGGCVVLRREDALRIPLDPRFVGWGQEDESWGIALHHLLGPAWRGPATLIHLWHPPQARHGRRRGSLESWKLRRRYFSARYEDGAMVALVEEARNALAAADPRLRHHASAR